MNPYDLKNAKVGFLKVDEQGNEYLKPIGFVNMNEMFGEPKEDDERLFKTHGYFTGTYRILKRWLKRKDGKIIKKKRLHKKEAKKQVCKRYKE